MVLRNQAWHDMARHGIAAGSAGHHRNGIWDGHRFCHWIRWNAVGHTTAGLAADAGCWLLVAGYPAGLLRFGCPAPVLLTPGLRPEVSRSFLAPSSLPALAPSHAPGLACVLAGVRRVRPGETWSTSSVHTQYKFAKRPYALSGLITVLIRATL